MVGRGPELAVLTDCLGIAISGGLQVVVIGGEAGIGKSRLVAEFAATVAGSAHVVVGHCLELGPDGPPFAPFSAVLRELIAELGVERVTELAGPGRDDLALLAPELGTGHHDDLLGRGRLFEGMATLLERAAAVRPLVVVVEDLHWSDTSTRDLLRFLMRTISDVPLLLVLTYRRDELVRTHPLRPWLVEVDRLPHTTRVVLDPLDDAGGRRAGGATLRAAPAAVGGPDPRAQPGDPLLRRGAHDVPGGRRPGDPRDAARADAHAPGPACPGQPGGGALGVGGGHPDRPWGPAGADGQRRGRPGLRPPGRRRGTGAGGRQQPGGLHVPACADA